jgi:hypothetical protein
VTSYQVIGVTPNATQYFVVRARDETGNHDDNTTEQSATIWSWYTFLGGPGDDQGWSITQVVDGGFVLVGVARANIPSLGGKTPIISYSSSTDIIVVKLSEDGSVEWYTFLGATLIQTGYSVSATSDGGVVLAGFTEADIASLGGKSPRNALDTADDLIVVKLTSSGSVDWYTFIGGSGQDRMDTFPSAITQNADGSYIVTGYSSAAITNMAGKAPLNAFSSPFEALVVKLTSSGDVDWYTFIGESGSQYGWGITQTNDGGFAVVGLSDNVITNLGGKAPLIAYAGGIGSDGFIVKLTSAGAVDWYTFIGSLDADAVRSADATSDGGVILLGDANANISSLGGKTPLNSYISGIDQLVVKLTNTGSVDWYTFLGGSGNDFGWGINESVNGGWIVAGYSSADIASMGGKTPNFGYSSGKDAVVTRLASDGTIDWYTFVGASGTDYGCAATTPTTDGGFALVGFSSANIASLGGQSAKRDYTAQDDIFVAKLLADGSL